MAKKNRVNLAGKLKQIVESRQQIPAPEINKSAASNKLLDKFVKPKDCQSDDLQPDLDRRPDQLSHVESTIPETANLLNGVQHIKGHLKIPNTIIDSLFRHLDLTEQCVYLQLFRLSWGFGKDSCMIGLPQLSARINASQKTVHVAIKKLLERGLVQKVKFQLGKGKQQGTIYRLVIPTRLVEITRLVESTNFVISTTKKNKNKNKNKIDKRQFTK
jgi:hypothetical protein